ncbi:hypothetical protein NL676_020394 [Syzygium grande]|nr:hypothetical protein NL676_020394 [Syzygium grande]
MMNKIKKEIEDGMKLIWKKVDPKDLQPGDHIYAYKRYGSYSHHGQSSSASLMLAYEISSSLFFLNWVLF